MTPASLARLFATERRRCRVPAALAISAEAPRSRRAMAYTDGRRVVFYARALRLPRSRLVALARHELAHVALMRLGRQHTERQADALAELLGGQPIRYDGCGVQTTGPGRRPRPRGLR